MQTPSGCPKYCSGCKKPFSIRGSRKEAQADQHLTCYGMTPECFVLAVKPVVLKRAS